MDDAQQLGFEIKISGIRMAATLPDRRVVFLSGVRGFALPRGGSGGGSEWGRCIRKASSWLVLPSRLALALVVASLMVGCKQPYRVGEHVLVEYDGETYPAFVKEKGGETKLIVHFEGCDSVWIREVSLDRIKGRIVESGGTARPRRYVCTPKQPAQEQKVANSPYKIGDRVRVRWRGSNYPATIVGIVAADRYLVHYDGHEAAWDEAIELDRIVGRK